MSAKSIQRMEAVGDLITKLKDTYPDAKKVNINIDFEWQEPNDVGLNSELCPRVKIEIER